MAKNNKKNSKAQGRGNNDESKDSSNDDKLEFQGEVVDCLPGTLFKVRIAEGATEVLATLAGKLYKNRIRILLGDRVTIEVSPYDLSRGRITWRR